MELATEMYERWQQGEAKSRLEIEYWGKGTAHGKAFSGYVRRWLGIETERQSSQSARIAYLEALLRANGVSPTEGRDLAEEYGLLAKSRESALAAVRVYNDPDAGFRTETFIVLMVIAWNSLLQAILERASVDYYERDGSGARIVVGGSEKVLGTWELVQLALGGDGYRAVRANLDFFLGLRNRISHRYLPALDVAVADEAQAMLLNFENLLVAQFGEEAALGDRLAVPLQLSGFRNEGSLRSLRKVQAQLPADVTTFLTSHRAGLDDDVLTSPEYCLRIFFVPIAANRERSADAVVRFVPPDKITPELEKQLSKVGVVTKRRITPVASADLLTPTEVVNLVRELLPYRFTIDTHTRCWKHYAVRPAGGSNDPEATDDRYCRWDRLAKGYGYTEAWVKKLVRNLSDEHTYRAVVGYPPVPRDQP
ncbi:MAG: DUF3644 domain-containing protein [bacterium]|nr:DUF3644 domain-containing protein [bacterium]MDE0437654.1 DUF3644 domain-containing protein [bacterium]